MTIIKMTLFNIERLFGTSHQVQERTLQKMAEKGIPPPNAKNLDPDMHHKMQMVEIGEDQLELLV